VALDAETGEYRWSYEPPPFSSLGVRGDDAEVVRRFMQKHDSPWCLPDSWSQNTISGDGTVYAGHQDGYLYAVRDENGDGKISSAEVSRHDLGSAFQASHAIAPGMFAAAPCDGGLYVWRY